MTRSRKSTRARAAQPVQPETRAAAVNESPAGEMQAGEPPAATAEARARSLQGLADSVHSAEAFWKAAAKFQRLR